jgi:acyl-CoA dehydrogenase
MGFLNGPIKGENVVVPVDAIIGGPKKAGKGWRMIMEQLGVGRSVSLPSISESSSRLSTFIASSRPRRQFGRDISKFEAVGRKLAFMGGLTYMMNAVRCATLASVDQNGEKPAVASAIAKYTSTEDNRRIVESAADIMGGQAVMAGPSNVIGQMYESTHLGVTVEGANIMTAAMIMGGQAIIRTHRYFLKQMQAINQAKPDKAELRRLVFGLAGSFLTNTFRSAAHGWGGGLLASAPVSDQGTQKFYKQINRLSAAFNVVATASFGLLGGKLMRLENTATRIGLIGANLERASFALWRFEKSGRLEALRPAASWAATHALHEAEENMDELFKNYPVPLVGAALRALTMPWRQISKPSDRLEHRLAASVTTPGAMRDFIANGIFISEDENDPVGRMKKAFDLSAAAAPIHDRLKNTPYRDVIKDNVLDEKTLQTATNNGIVTPGEAETLRSEEAAMLEANRVDVFDRTLTHLVV